MLYIKIIKTANFISNTAMENNEQYYRYELSAYFLEERKKGLPYLEYIVKDEINGIQPKPFTHAHAELNLCAKGEAMCNVNSEKKILKEGEFYLVNSFDTHANGAELECTFYILGFTNIKFDFLKNGNSFFFTSGSPCLSNSLSSLFWIIQNDVHNKHELIHKYFDLILEIITFESKSRNAWISELEPKDTIEAIANYINVNYLENISIPLLAKKFALSESSLMHSFKKKYNVSLIEYLRQRRLKEALFMLEIMDDSIQKIASITGFNSFQYFYHYFKKKMGMTPLKYRKKLKTNK